MTDDPPATIHSERERNPMTDSILSKYVNRSAEDVPDGGGFDQELAEDQGAYGWLRGIRDRATMLELRKKNGNILALGYAWLEKVEYDPSDGITLHFVTQKIRLEGRNLNTQSPNTISLLQGLMRHRVVWIQEEQAVEFDSGRTMLVEKIVLL